VKHGVEALLLVLLTGAAAGCGGSSKPDPIYAGMTLSSVRNQALVQSGSQTTDGADPLFSHHLRLVGIKKGHDPAAGDPAWIVVFRDLSDYRKTRYCLWFANGEYVGGIDLQPCKAP
jgi:hypothetical protein